MNPKVILILDDLASVAKSFRDRLNLEYPAGPIPVECFSEERDFKHRLDNSDVCTTLVLVNAAFKSNESFYRYKLEGVRRIIKLGLRITWLRREPVIAYGTVRQKELLQCRTGKIFHSGPSHQYFNIAEIHKTNIKSLIDRAAPLADEKALREIIWQACAGELIQFIASADHLLGKTYKLDSEEGRREVVNDLTHLRRILSEVYLDSQKFEDTIKVLKNKRAALGVVHKSVKSLRSSLQLILEKLKQKESAHASA